MTIQEAIEKSYQNGYGAKHATTFARVPNEITGIDVALDSIFLDPLFWQCLEKSIWNSLTYKKLNLSKKNGGWWERECLRCHEIPEVIDSPHRHGVFGKGLGCGGQVKEVWHKHFRWDRSWHEMIDHLADGGTIESYFENL